MDSSSVPEGNDVNTESQSNQQTEEGRSTQNSRGKRKITPGKSASASKAKKAVPKTRSPVWDHFTRYPDDKDVCKCNYCAKDFACPTSSGTSNLGKHLECCKPYKVFKEATQTVITNDGETLKFGRVTEEVFREASYEMLVLGELPLVFIEGVAWKHFCKKVKLWKPHSRRTATRDIVSMFVGRKASMKTWLANSKQRVSLTTDIWTAPTTGASYMVITLHFIDVNWHLRKLIIGFKFITDHRGATISRVLLECLAEWGIEKVFTITVDNATANTSALQKFQRAFSLLGNDALVLKGEFMHMRCCAHIINLVVSDGLHEVDANIEAIRYAILYVRASTKRMEAFDARVEVGKNATRGSLPLDCKTRWNSTHLMLTKAMKYRSTFDRMEAEDKLYNDYFLEVENGKKRQGPPTKADWIAIEKLVSFMRLFYNSTLVVSASTSVSSYKTYGEIVTIEKNLIALSNSLDKDLSEKATNMRDKFDKYWDGFNNINKLLIVASVFDPRKKMHFAQLCFEELYGQDSAQAKIMYELVYNVLVSLFKEYSSAYKRVPTEAPPTVHDGNDFGSQNVDAELGMDCIVEGIRLESIDLKYKSMVNKKGLEDVRDELEIYLKDKVENQMTTMFGDSFDVLSWWRVNCGKYPVLSEIARDVLAMQVSSVASESAFSTSGRIIEPSRSCLSHYTIEVLMCTEQWLKQEMQLKDNGVLTNADLLADIEMQDSIQKEFEGQLNMPTSD